MDEPLEVRVDGEPGYPERVAKDDVGRLAADAGQRVQVLHPVGHLAAEPVDERLAQLDQRIGLVAVEAGRFEQLLQLGPVGGGVVGRRRVPREQLGADLVDPHVGGLRRQHRRDRELQRVAVVELAVRVGVRLGERPGHPAGTALAGQISLVLHVREPTTRV